MSTTSKRSAQPRQRGPIGRKMHRWTSECGSRVEFFTSKTEAKERGKNWDEWGSDSGKVEPVLVLDLDPANVERIEQLAAKLIIGRHGGCFEQHSQGIYATLLVLGLTPAKRRGK